MNTNANVLKLVRRLVETKAETIKLGLDVHARDVVVCVQADGALAQRGQRMTAGQVVALGRGLREAGLAVYSCHEAGPCGFGLHRQLEAAGVVSHVVAPEMLGDGRRQKTDALDAAALVDRLDRYVRGNTKAFTVVRVPSEQEERARAQGRLRELSTLARI